MVSLSWFWYSTYEYSQRLERSIRSLDEEKERFPTRSRKEANLVLKWKEQQHCFVLPDVKCVLPVDGRCFRGVFAIVRPIVFSPTDFLNGSVAFPVNFRHRRETVISGLTLRSLSTASLCRFPLSPPLHLLLIKSQKDLFPFPNNFWQAGHPTPIFVHTLERRIQSGNF